MLLKKKKKYLGSELGGSALASMCSSTLVRPLDLWLLFSSDSCSSDLMVQL